MKGDLMWQAYLRSVQMPLLLLAWAAASVFGIMGGPFGTYEWLSFGERMIYWPLLGAVGVLLGCALRLLYEEVLGVTPFWAYALLNATTTGILMAFPYQFLLQFFTEADRAHLPSLMLLGSYNFATTLFCIVTRVVFYPEQNKEPPEERVEFTPVPLDPAIFGPRLLRRLPERYRGDILHLRSRDHYVHITTTNGSKQILMRLADAIEELDGVEGLQVHRSHWVAQEAVRDARKLSSKAQLTLSNGVVVPVSRTYLAEAEAAGLFDTPPEPIVRCQPG